MRERIKDKGRLEHILEAAEYVRQFSSGISFDEFCADKMRHFAIVKNIEIIGEAAYMLTTEFKNSHPELPWRAIVNMRHVLVHGYYAVSDILLWDTIQNDIDEIATVVAGYLKSENLQ